MKRNGDRKEEDLLIFCYPVIAKEGKKERNLKSKSPRPRSGTTRSRCEELHGRTTILYGCGGKSTARKMNPFRDETRLPSLSDPSLAGS